MNRFLTAQEALQDALAGIESRELAARLTMKIYPLFYISNDLSTNDPNHPFTRFATPDDREGNRLRLFQAVQDLLGDNDNALQPLVDMMFETPGTEPYTKVNAVLSRFLVYADNMRNNSSDEDDSDNSDSSDSS
jgi:hypothetical protein